MKMPAGPLVLSATPVVAAFVVGVLITVFAAWLPGRRAAKIPPVAAMNSVHAVATTKSLVLRNSIGAAVTALGAVGIVAGASTGRRRRPAVHRRGRVPGAHRRDRPHPAAVPARDRTRPSAARGPFGVAGKLAGQNAVRNPRRTGATASALAIGLTLVTALSVLGVTVGAAIDKMTTDNIRADYMVSMANGGDLDRSALTALEKADGVSAVSPQQDAYFRVDGDFVSASGGHPGRHREGPDRRHRQRQRGLARPGPGSRSPRRRPRAGAGSPATPSPSPSTTTRRPS